MVTEMRDLLTNLIVIISQYMFIRLSYCIPETYIMLHVNYISMKLEKKRQRKILTAYVMIKEVDSMFSIYFTHLLGLLRCPFECLFK